MLVCLGRYQSIRDADHGQSHGQDMRDPNDAAIDAVRIATFLQDRNARVHR